MAIVKSFISFVFSLRGAVLALLLGLLVVKSLPTSWYWLDRALIKVAAQLVLPRTKLVDTVLVELSPKQWQGLQNDPVQVTDVMALLEALQASPVAVTAVFVDQLPRLQLHASERLLQAEDSQQAGNYLRQRQHALAILKQEKLVFVRPGVLEGSTINSLPVDTVESQETDWYSLLPTVMRPQPQKLSTQARLKPARAGENSLAPMNAGPSYPLLLGDKDLLLASTALTLLQQSLGASTLEWHRYQQFHIGKQIFPGSADGSVVPFYSNDSGASAAFKKLSVTQALDAVPDKAIVLIGREGDPQPGILGDVLVSLQQGAYWYSPYWFYAAEKLLLLVLGLFLLLLYPRLNKGVALLSSVLLLILMLGAQLGWMVTQWQWLPMGVAAEFLLIGSFLMSVWSSQWRKWRQLELECHESNFQLAQHWYQQDQLKQALDAIAKCHATEPVLALAYNVAAQQERKRQYDAAADTYQMIDSQKRGYKDAAKRASALASLKMGNSQELAAVEGADTLVLPDANVNRPVLGRYEIERELGRGAMGVVYLGRDPKIGRRVAIKTLNYKQFDSSQVKSLKERFFREAEAAGRLHHPNIVTVYDVGEEPDLAFIAMDFVEGNSLGDYMSAETLLPVHTVYELVAQVAEALAYAHQQNIVHRDIKPGNIMYNPASGQIKVADFGIARIIDDSKTKTGDILGSPIYMSPEQLKGSKVSGATDIYSLGVTFYQLLTAEVPFNGDSIANLAYQILNKKYKSVRELRPELPASAARIVNKAMQKDPAKRYADGALMAEALRKSLGRDF